MKRFDGKVALVTGASSGMGAATADLLAECGARVFTAQRGSTAHESIAADFSDRATPARVIRTGFVTGQALPVDGGYMAGHRFGVAELMGLG